MDIREWPWFRATARSAWHIVDRREDQELRALCGYAHRWARSEQTRSAVAPDRACAICLGKAGINPAQP